MKKIIVPMATRLPDGEKTTPLHFVRSTYIRKMAKYGLCPVFVSAETPLKIIDQLYGETEGALFVGGGDFNSSTYGEANHPLNDQKEPQRDKLELYLLKRILTDRKPFLGICRGCQALAIASGGTLKQHIPDLGIDEKHNSLKYDDLTVPVVSHRIIIEPKSRASKIVRKNEATVNSGHHQCVRTLGPDLVISAASPAGIVEIIEHINPKYFCFGIQSHPEALEDSDLEPFFSEFSKAVSQV